jgi:hypothetical protein
MTCDNATAVAAGCHALQHPGLPVPVEGSHMPAGTAAPCSVHRSEPSLCYRHFHQRAPGVLQVTQLQQHSSALGGRSRPAAQLLQPATDHPVSNPSVTPDADCQ